MSFLNISDPAKRDLIIKEFLELKRNIRNNLLGERTGEQQLQTDLSKFFTPITKTQKATTREITEGLKPNTEGIENLPQATQPLGKEEKEEKEEEENEYNIGKIAKKYIYRPNTDKTFGIREEKGLYYIGDKRAIIFCNNIIIDSEKFEGTPGLWELITAKKPISYENEDRDNYERLMLKTNVLHCGNDPNNPYPKGNRSFKWDKVLKSTWREKKKMRDSMRERGLLLF